MSTYYGYRCPKCKISSESWFQDKEVLRTVLNKWREIESLIQEPWLEVDILGGRGHDVFEFVEAHYDHKLLIENQYGDLVP